MTNPENGETAISWGFFPVTVEGRACPGPLFYRSPGLSQLWASSGQTTQRPQAERARAPEPSQGPPRHRPPTVSPMISTNPGPRPAGAARPAPQEAQRRSSTAWRKADQQVWHLAGGQGGAAEARGRPSLAQARMPS